MAIQKKVKRSRGASPRHSIALTKGDWLDVMDQDGVWNVARVLNVPSAEEVEVMYDGWPEEYDEVVRVESDRVAPFHTFTWAVKCWVKYLNWPMWPSVITIRTPGNAEGVKNLEQENRLYVDFLEDPNFARRDRCWQKKQKVKRFDDNFDGKRTGTNGAQFERALGCVLLSDATTKMPKFVSGTLPMQYENSTTESVEWMRKSMGKALWYKNFANNKDRHIRAHMYDTNNDDTEDSESSVGDDEAVPVAKVKVRRPKQRATSGESDVAAPPKKKKRALSAKKTHQSTVKIEPESSADVEVPHELESMESSDDSESGREKETVLKKRRRVQVKTRAAVSPVAGKKQPSSSQDSNVASAMPRHVTVAMDEIIVDDDDDDSDSSDAARTKKTKKAVSSPARNLRSSRAKRDISSGGNFSSHSDAKEISPSSNKSRTTAKKTFSAKRVEPAAQRSKIIDSRSEDDEDESDGSDSYDLGTTSEDKNASPLGSQFGFGSPTATSFSKGKAIAAESGPAHSQHRSSVTAQNLSSSPRRTKKKIYDKGQTKVGARRSIPPLSRDLSLAASPKARPTRSTSSDEDDSEEEKGVPKAAATDVARDEFKPTKLDSHRSKQARQKVGESGGVQSQISSKQPRPSKRPKAPQSLIEQRIALVQKGLKDLNRQKQRESENIAAKKRQKMTSPLSGTRDRSQQKSPVVKPRLHQRNDSDLSFLQEDRKGSRSSSMLEGEGASQGRLPATWSELDSVSRNLSHSFLSVDAAYSYDRQDSKSVPSQFDGEGLTPFDDPVDFQSDPKESKRAKSAKGKLRAEAKDSGDAKQQAEDEASEDDSGDEKSQEVRRSCCVMRADLEDVPSVDEGEKVRISKRTVMSMPRKFKETVKGAQGATSSKESMLQIEPQPDDVPVTPPPAVVFCSSEGFTMEKWLREHHTVKKKMRSHSEDDGSLKDVPECTRRPLYTVRQPPLIQPLRQSAFSQKTCSHFGISPDDLAHEWVVLFQAISGGKMGDGMLLQIPDTVLLSPSGQPSVWYSTSSSGRVKAKDLMRVSPQSIFEAFQAQIQRHPITSSDEVAAVRRLGFDVNPLSSPQLKAFCRDMEFPDICLPLQPDSSSSSSSSSARSGLTKGVFCLQRHVACQNDASFLVVWRHSLLPSSSADQNDHPASERVINSPRRSRNVNCRTPRARSGVFLLTRTHDEYVAGDDIDERADTAREESQPRRSVPHTAQKLVPLEIDDPKSTTWKALRKGGFDPDVMAPLLFYMKRVTSEIANCINLERNTRQACGLACEFFVGEHNRSVYFSALRGIQWVSSAPSWGTLREVDPLSRSLCEFYENTGVSGCHLRGKSPGRSSPPKPRSPISDDREKSAYYEQNPRFPSVHTPFAGEKQWLHRSQLLAPDISPRYVGASVPKIYRDGVFQSLLTAHQADSVVRLNLSPQAPSSLAEVRRQEPHASPRSASFRRKTTKTTASAAESSASISKASDAVCESTKKS